MMLRWIAVLILSVIATITGAHAERRVALVIGNSNYQFAPPLPNPAADAEAMAALLKNLGFEVVAGVDLSREKMTATLAEFAALSDGADAGLFFYAGHGIAVGGTNYLIPVDANLKSELDVKLGAAIDLDVTLQQTLGGSKVKLVFLDACRDNPFAAQIARSMPKTRAVTMGTGLAEMRSADGTLIAYATSPGEVALDGDKGHSPFTTALLKYLPEPGLEIGIAMTHVRAFVQEETGKQQKPWENKNLTGLFYMNGEPAAPAGSDTEASKATVSSGPAAGDVEMEFWRTVKDSRNKAEIEAYLAKYPDGMFAEIAKTRLASLGDPASPGAGDTPTAAADKPAFTPDPAITTAEASLATEDALGLDKDQRRGVQRQLSSLRYGSRSIDGDFGETTRRGIAKWQTARGYPVTGYLNRYQYDALMAENIEEASLTSEENEPAKAGNAPSTKKKTKQAATTKKKKTASTQKRRNNGPTPGRVIRKVIKSFF